MIDRIRNLLGIGRATLADDSGELQLLQVTEGSSGKGVGDRITDKVRRICEFGFTSVPPMGAEVLVACRNGQRSTPMVLATSHRPSRPRNLQPGDSALYDVRGARVQLTAAGLVIDCAGLPAVIRNFSTLTVMGDLHVTGDVISRSTGAAVSLNGLRDAYHAHGHTQVKAGTDTSGTTDHDA